MEVLYNIINIALTALGVFGIINPVRAAQGQAIAVKWCMNLLGFECAVTPTPRAYMIVRIWNIAFIALAVGMFIKHV